MNIIGSGKWAKLIKNKLNILGIENYIIGNNKEVCDYSKNEIWKCKKDSYVIIASATHNHLSDLKLSLELNPKEIYVEKGFENVEDYTIAKNMTDIPIFFLSQYRYSAVFKILKKINETITKIDYTWNINNSNVSEWAFHILSIDNFIKNKNNKMIINDEGFYRIDDVSDFLITKKENRSLTIDIETSSYSIKITLGNNNIIEILENSISKKLEFQNEDCLFKQLKDIFTFRENDILERL